MELELEFAAFIFHVFPSKSLLTKKYDLESSTYSPDGRVFQVEYAQKAVDNSG